MWKIQSKYIREKEKKCITCGSTKDLQAGHFVHGDSLDFDERNIHCQCLFCNYYQSGNLIEYTKKMLEMYGMEVIEELQQKKREIFKPTQEWLEKRIEYFKGLE